MFVYLTLVFLFAIVVKTSGASAHLVVLCLKERVAYKSCLVVYIARSRMGVLDDLVPFVRFAQFVGLFPFKIKRNSLSGRFDGFKFSCSHLITFWYVLVLVVQVAPLIKHAMPMLPQDNLNGNFNSSSKLPAIFNLPIYTHLSVHYAMIVIIRSATLRYRQLNLVFNYLNSDTLRELEGLENGCRNTIKKRSLIGISLILMTVCKVSIN